jgi:hypothetical protein
VDPAEHVLREQLAQVVGAGQRVLDPGLDVLTLLLASLLALVVEVVIRPEHIRIHSKFIVAALDPAGRHRDLHQGHGQDQVIDPVVARPRATRAPRSPARYSDLGDWPTRLGKPGQALPN